MITIKRERRETEAIFSCYGPYSPAPGMVPKSGYRRLSFRARLWHKIHPFSAPLERASIGRRAAVPPSPPGCWQHPALGLAQRPLLRRSPRCPGPRVARREMDGATSTPAKEVEVSKLNACVIYAEPTRLFVLSHVAQIPALVSTKHYSCARSSFKSLIPTGLLTCAGIPRRCA